MGQKGGGTRKAARNDESGRRPGRQESRPDATAAAQIGRLVGGWGPKVPRPPPAAVFVADLLSRVWEVPAEEMMPRYL
jgi:hypothetical protein